jgi:hypothetical protein
VQIAPLTRSEYRAALTVRADTQRDLNYLVAEGEPTPETVAVLAGLVNSLDVAIAEFESRRPVGRLLVVGRGRSGTLVFNRALEEHRQRIEALFADPPSTSFTD